MMDDREYYKIIYKTSKWSLCNSIESLRFDARVAKIGIKYDDYELYLQERKWMLIHLRDIIDNRARVLKYMMLV